MTGDEQQRLARLKPNLERRALIYEITREFFRERGFLEVQTPTRVPTVAPEQHIIPFESEGWFLSTSPELHMKRLLAAGYERLFQFAPCFRKGERGRRHNPEFTMLEWYRAGGDYLDMVRDTEGLVSFIAARLKRGNTIDYQGGKIDLTPPWPAFTVRDAFRRFAGWDPVKESDPRRFDTDLVTKVVPGFDPGRPLVLLDYPATMAALARLKPDDPFVAERAETFIAGLELTNGYSELIDAREQEKRFSEERRLIERERRQSLAPPSSFIEAVRRLPPCGGIALGMDRLVMLFCDAGSIDEVVAFTQETA